MKNDQKLLNIIAGVLAILLIAVVIWGLFRNSDSESVPVSDGIDQVDLDRLDLKDSGVEVNFADIIISNHNETRKLIVSTQNGTVTTELTDRLINKLDFNFLKKTQNVSYTGTGYFVVDLDKLTASNVIVDRNKKLITIRIEHPYLRAIEIDPDNIIIDEVKEGLLARGKIKLTVEDYNEIEMDLRSRLEEKFNTAANGQAADDMAIKMVEEVYEPVIKAIDSRYDVIVEFK